jgi:DNA-binding LacI/PurR family transcriptional regulator
VDKLFMSYLPVVAIANPVPGLPSVTVDDMTGSQMLARYLADKGHRHLLYRADHLVHSSTVRRRDAFLETAAELGMTVIVTAESSTGHITPFEAALLTGSGASRPTAVVSWVDSQAYIFIEDCTALGIRVPDDLAVVGFDGVVPTMRPACRLTTIRAPWEEAAAIAVNHLMSLLEGHEVQRETMLPVELVIGDTA